MTYKGLIRLVTTIFPRIHKTVLPMMKNKAINFIVKRVLPLKAWFVATLCDAGLFKG